jgi:PEGA domain
LLKLGDPVTTPTVYIALCCMLIAILVRAQSTRNITQAEPARAVAARNSVHAEFTLRDGIPIRLRLKRNLSSSNATVGQFVDFEVLEEVTVNGVVVIPKGGKAMGSVTEAIPKKRMRRAGRLEIVLDYVRLTDRETAAVRAVEDAGGGSNATERPAGIVTTGLLFWPGAPFVLFVHGKDMTIPKGAEVTAYVNGDLKLNATKFVLAAGANGSAPTSASTPALSSTAPVPLSAVLGSIEVHSSPESAEVYADGSFIGDAPATLKLSAGQHSIKVILSGYEEWSRELSVESGSEAHLTATLKRLD